MKASQQSISVSLNDKIAKLSISRLVYMIFMRCSNCQLQFEKEITLLLTSDVDLKLMVIYWPKLGSWVKFNIDV